MQKCNHYPNCECYSDWEEPAKEINSENADLFVTIMQEIESLLDRTHPLKYEFIFTSIQGKLDILPLDLHSLFFGKLLPFIEFHYAWKMQAKSDLVKLKRAFIKELSANYEMEYYTDKKNIPNQNLVKETIEYFQKGEGSRAFKPLEFLNLLENQWQFIISNWTNSDNVIDHLKNLPLNEVEKHILFGLTLKWMGGYPIIEGNESDPRVGDTKKAIEKEFLNYVGETPEKEFCKADNEDRRYFDKLGIAFTTAINNNIDVKEILDAMPRTNLDKKVYYSFDEMFDDAERNGAVGNFETRQLFFIARSRYNFEFNAWLQETKGFEYGNKRQYENFLTKDIFIEFLKYQNNSDEKRKTEYEQEKASWRIKPQENPKNDAVKLIAERLRMIDFFWIDAPDILHKNAFWHDENNVPIDCNIYHPKYGYPGLITDTKDIVLTSFSNVIIYQDERSGKYIHCKYCQQILCTPDEVNFTNKDGEKVLKIEYLQKYQKRMAETEQDFELIYQRELTKSGITDHKFFKSFLLEIVSAKEEEYKASLTNEEKEKDAKTLELFYKFKNWINKREKKVNDSKLNIEEREQAAMSKISFGYRKTDPQILSRIYNGLTEQLDGFISEEENTFINVFTAKDLRELEEIITLQCDNPQFHFIIKNMQHLFKEKILSIVGTSGKFFSKRGVVLTANSLSKAGSNQPIPKGKEEIEKIFRQIKQ